MSKARAWDTLFEDDPACGLLNLFDLWIVFTVALLIALFAFLRKEGIVTESDAAKEKLSAQFKKAPVFKQAQGSAQGDGTRLGVAYRLESGEIVYIPDSE